LGSFEDLLRKNEGEGTSCRDGRGEPQVADHFTRFLCAERLRVKSSQSIKCVPSSRAGHLPIETGWQSIHRVIVGWPWDDGSE
jgi:hypothetical protein